MSTITEWISLHFISRVTLILIALALIIATAFPLIRTDDWWIRIFDFPRIQISVLIILTLIGFAALHHYGHLGKWDYILTAVVGLALVWQIISIAPYTPFYPKQMSDSYAVEKSNRISFLIFNVLYNNREVDALRELIRDNDPDIIMLSEPTQWWLDQLDGLEKDYPYTLYQPQDNHYGKLLYSRLELVNPEIRFLIESEIPSIRTQIRLHSGTLVTLYGVHPRPPGLKRPDEENGNGKDEDEAQEEGDREDSDMRDAELLLVAQEVSELVDVPVIVAGDFNDVAWSHTTHLFQRTGGLLDPRVGRGLFNSFDTGSQFLRYPLDHVFASQHFLLVDLRRLPNIGSDHFPMLVVLDFDPKATIVNEVPQPDAGDAKEAKKSIEEGKSNN